MELVELTEQLELLVPTKYFLYPCETALREVGIVKPLNKLAQLGDNRDDSIIWSRIE